MLMSITEEQIKHMVDRFLGWKLPRDTFNPDCGISFDKKPYNTHTAHPMQYEPSGTNLFDAEQATAMVRHIVEGLPSCSDFRWLIEAPGQRYLAVQRLNWSDNFEWTSDHNEALAFRSKEQAEALMMAVRQMDRACARGLLFAFEVPLGNAAAIEHGWI